ncbi:XamI family restriction endonuclease [Bradyrhizobium sp. SZCCHNRI1009]|uniref:XamI family restriction endonuclease n=1 Tax=Bradyrhizobium sp. SZCCHNRI1009 TaxID=3057277 RepID=UPI0029164DE7|nr:XamI family restriction endonuclease [Bradyrhizobium sp. SZCCHNRI1009]
MPVNLDKPQNWKADIAASVDMYNTWFMRFAPKAFRDTRVETTKSVEATLAATDNMRDIKPAILRRHPEVLSTLRMSTCPPLAVDRLIGLSGVSPNLVKTMEDDKRLPPRMSAALADEQLSKIGDIIEQLADPDIFVWLKRTEGPEPPEIHRAATIIADRLCGSVANPIIRNAQEKRQLEAIKRWLEARGYAQAPVGTLFDQMTAGTFSFRMNVPVKLEGLAQTVNIPVDAVIKPKGSPKGELPIFIEAKSAGDFTNTNKRRKEEAVKMSQLRSNYQTPTQQVRFNLFLCGYFDSGYLGYEAAEGIDWVWEHRIDDLAQFGI